MNLRFVEAFYWVATLQSVTRAAEKLFLTQSAMSSRIAALEEELGVPLLDRRDRHFRLTAAGMRFCVHAHRLMELQREIKTELGAGQAQPLALRLGAIESVLHSWLIPLVERLRCAHEGLEVQLSVETTPVLLEQARRGALDLVFAAQPAGGTELRTRSLPPMEMVFVGHADRHAAGPVRLADLAGLDLLTFQRGSQPHVALLDLFRQAGLALRRVHTMSSVYAMVQLAEAGFGVATLPRSVASSLHPGRRLRLLELDASLPPLPVFASWRVDPGCRLVETAAQAAVAFLERQARPGGRVPDRHERADAAPEKAGAG